MSDDMRIIPERDEVRARSQTQTAKRNVTSARPTKARSQSAPQKKSQPSSALTWVLSILVVILGGASAFLYIQTQTLGEEKDALAQRVADIESKLSVTDESLSQSGAAIQAMLREHAGELELHFSEIDKLWQVSNKRNREWIEELQRGQSDDKARLDAISSSVAGLDPIIQGYDGVQSRMETIASQLLVQSATLDDLSARARDLVDANASIESQNTTQSGMLREHEEAIEAIDEYRLQINQRLLRLEQSMGSSTPAGI